MDALPLTGNYPPKAEMKNYGKFGHIIGRIQSITIMSIIDICYIAYHLGTQNVTPTLPVLQGLNLRIQYLDSHLHRPIFYPSNCYYGSNVIRLT